MIKKNGTPKIRRQYFELEAEISAIDDAIIQIIRARQQQFINTKLSEENTLHYTHGTKWSSPANERAINGDFNAHSVEWQTHIPDMVDGDLALITKFIEHMDTELQRKFSTMIYSSINEITAKTGNVVSAKDEGGFPNAFLEMLRKIEFGVDRQGNVSMPQLHTASPDKLMAELQSQPPEFQAEVERLTAEKKNAALAEEAIRKSKFKTTKP